MVGKPLFDILLKLPAKSLLRFRCVSKLWREYIDDSYFVSVHDKQVTQDPTPIIFYSKTYMAKTLCFHTIESDTITNHFLKVKSNPICEFVGKKLSVVGSCNGLVLIKTYNDQKFTTIFTVIHPINKQCYVLPELRCDRVSCGLGFDSSTNTFKIVCVLYHNPTTFSCGARRAHCTMVHVFGTNSWQKIPQVPSYRISGKAIFAHGCLHWLVSYNYGEDGERQVIWFDVKNEEFELIKPPKTISKPSKRQPNHPINDHLVNLDGQVGYFGNKTTEVWVLNHKKEWVLHCNLEDHLPDGYIKVLGCLNKAGDILITVTKWPSEKEWFYIYNLKNRVVHEARIDGLDLEDGSETDMDMVMFPNSLCDIMTNSNLFSKKELEENMERFWQRSAQSFKSLV
ncbi:F-box domain containing protein [Tanacetum coccineum]